MMTTRLILVAAFLLATFQAHAVNRTGRVRTKGRKANTQRLDRQLSRVLTDYRARPSDQTLMGVFRAAGELAVAQKDLAQAKDLAKSSAETLKEIGHLLTAKRKGVFVAPIQQGVMSRLEEVVAKSGSRRLAATVPDLVATRAAKFIKTLVREGSGESQKGAIEAVVDSVHSPVERMALLRTLDAMASEVTFTGQQRSALYAGIERAGLTLKSNPRYRTEAENIILGPFHSVKLSPQQYELDRIF